MVNMGMEQPFGFTLTMWDVKLDLSVYVPEGFGVLP